jgi:glycosyltransferase involved in cell wall biosynthesis
MEKPESKSNQAGSGDSPNSLDLLSAVKTLGARISNMEAKLNTLYAGGATGESGQLSEEAAPSITFISPCYNEAENLETLFQRITTTCREASIANYEILWIENGSIDSSFEIMCHLREIDPRLKIIQLSRNFGYQGAISCGLQYARGEWVAILDGDLQDPPELIIKMLALAHEKGVEVVYGVRKKREETLPLKIAYAAFYRVWRLSAEISVPLDAGDFGIMHRRVVEVINKMPERQRFVRGLRAWTGFHQCGMPYERKKRAAGETKFHLWGMLGLALDGLMSYSVVPLRATVLLGILLTFGTIVLSATQAFFRLLAYLDVTEVTGILPPGLTQINILVSGLIGLNMICTGIVAEYVGRIYNETKNRPIYVIRSKHF